MGVEIKPCAFCGGRDQIDFGMLTLHCDDCGASVSENKWNARPIEDALQAELANLKAENARLAGIIAVARAACDDLWVYEYERDAERHICSTISAILDAPEAQP